MTTLLLMLHGLMAVALLGAVSHQAASLFFRQQAAGGAFVARYSRIDAAGFVWPIFWLYLGVFVLGGLIYPSYRVDVRIPFEELGLRWAVGLFEIKEHAAGIGFGILPLYVVLWRSAGDQSSITNRRMVTAFLAGVIWFDFLAGHLLNNIRGLA
jgi:hypothetical protein